MYSPFLDILVQRRDDGKLTTSAFRKTRNALKTLYYKSIILRHIEGAVIKSHSNDWRLAAAHQEPEKKYSIPSNDNSPSMATRAHSFRRLCGNCFCKTEQAVTNIVNISEAMAHLLKPNRIGAARRPEGTFRSRWM